MAKSKYINVDDHLLTFLVGNTAWHGEFPMFKQAANLIRSNRTCCRNRPAHHSIDMRALKERLKNMDRTKLNRLKELLGTEKLVFWVVTQKGAEKLEK